MIDMENDSEEELEKVEYQFHELKKHLNDKEALSVPIQNDHRKAS